MRMKSLCTACELLLVVSALLRMESAEAFSLIQPNSCANFRIVASSSSSVFSTPPPRQPRRMLKKRRTRERQGRSITPAQQFPWDTTESRPLISSVSKEAGEDYWIDEKDLEKERRRKDGIKNRKAMEGEVSKEKLWSEVKAPYKQNWIGYFSVVIAILSAIIIKFPELLDQPVIAFPDL